MVTRASRYCLYPCGVSRASLVSLSKQTTEISHFVKGTLTVRDAPAGDLIDSEATRQGVVAQIALNPHDLLYGLGQTAV